MARRVPFRDHDQPLSPDEVIARRTEIGGRIRLHRAAAGLSQEAVAERAGLERKAISRAETGTHALTLDALVRVAHALGMSESELLDD